MITTCGIDIGSSSVKAAIVRSDAGSGRNREGAEILATAVERIRRRDPKQVIRGVFERALEAAGVEEGELSYIATTGEGELVDFSTGHFYGMTAHARGALFLDDRARVALDVGALHARAISLDPEARVLGYRMTSQCASGSGQFLENIARYLGVTLEEVGELSMQGEKPEKVSGICAVLAETDVINMVSRGISLPNILRGIHDSMANRLAKLVRKLELGDGVIMLTGGLAKDAGLVEATRVALGEMRIDAEVVQHDLSISAGAIGSALWGAYRFERMNEPALETAPC
jgi:benzoyl-CoA reductase subunit D